MNARIYSSEQSLILGSVQNLLVLDWRGEVTVDNQQRASRWMNLLLEQQSAGIALMVITRSQNPLPSAAAREEGTRVIRSMGNSLLAEALVVTGDEIRTALLRSLLRGIGILSRKRSPTSVFGEVDSASQWISRFIRGADGHSVSPFALTAAIRTISDGTAPTRSL